MVITRYAADLPEEYLPGLRSGMVVRFGDLDLLPHYPARPSVALPTNEFEDRPNGRFIIYEICALGGVAGGSNAIQGYSNHER